MGTNSEWAVGWAAAPALADTPLVNLDEPEPELTSQLFFLLIDTQAARSDPCLDSNHELDKISKLASY
jgi:hypothetical protein